MVKDRWEIENNNFRYFDKNGELIVHLFRHLGVWRGFVLGHEKPIKRKRLTDALEDVRKALKESGWENE
tara:strand:+ start:2843 stop:3049 length:207 start_codon:yes stop_codon:yes gene_type:complete